MAIITGTPLDDLLNGTNKADTIYGLEGSDTINGLQGDDKIVGEQESLIYSLIGNPTGPFTAEPQAGTITTIPTSVTFGGDNLFGDQGNDSLYGDLVALAFVVEAGPEVSQTFGSFTVLLGDDALDGGMGNDLLVGDVDNILLSAHAGSTSAALPLGDANAILQNISLTMGVDTLYGGDGIDTLYGDVRLMTLESIAGTANDPTTGNQQSSALIQFITFQSNTDYLYGGNGDDVLVGDVGTLNLFSQAGNALGTGDVANGYIRPIIVSDPPNTFTMGGDFLYGDNGNDTLYGDIDTLNLTAISGIGNGGAQARGQIIGNVFNMGADELHGGNGNDRLYGDIGTLSLFGQGGQSLTATSTTAFIQPFTFNPDVNPDRFNMGDDLLYGEAGNDRIVGDIGTMTIEGRAGSSSAAAFSNAQVVGTFFMGDDYLNGGGGDDFLWGDVENLSIIGQGGTVSAAGTFSEALVGAKISMGVDTLIGGDGNDHLYGDVGAFTVSMTAGTVTSTSTNPNASTFAGPEDVFPIAVTMGVDNLVGGSGDDFLYGDVGTLSISLTGGTNSELSTSVFGAVSVIWDSTFAMGNDTLDGGSGNDQLYGDLGSFSAILTLGTGSGTTPQINNTKIQFGNDTLIGGSGDDILVGDIADPTQLAGFLNAPLSNVPDFPAIANQLIFGNDTFQFSLGGSNGNDVVKDMNVGAVSTATTTVTDVMDTLQFSGAASVAAVDAASTFSNSGGHLLLSFNAGGSVLFENINWAGQDSVLDITPNVTVI